VHLYFDCLTAESVKPRSCALGFGTNPGLAIALQLGAVQSHALVLGQMAGHLLNSHMSGMPGLSDSSAVWPGLAVRLQLLRQDALAVLHTEHFDHCCAKHECLFGRV